MRSFLKCFPCPLLFIHQESKREIFITIKIGGKLLKKKELKNLAATIESDNCF